MPVQIQKYDGLFPHICLVDTVDRFFTIVLYIALVGSSLSVVSNFNGLFVKNVTNDVNTYIVDIVDRCILVGRYINI